MLNWKDLLIYASIWCLFVFFLFLLIFNRFFIIQSQTTLFRFTFWKAGSADGTKNLKRYPMLLLGSFMSLLAMGTDPYWPTVLLHQRKGTKKGFKILVAWLFWCPLFHPNFNYVISVKLLQWGKYKGLCVTLTTSIQFKMIFKKRALNGFFHPFSDLSEVSSHTLVW